MLKEEYISAAGGLPIVNRPAIRHRIQMDLLIKANTYEPSLLQPGGGGQFIYDYDVANHAVTEGFIFTSEDLKPVEEWRFSRLGTQLWIPQGESAALDVFRREPTIQPADLPFSKSVYINFSTSGGLDIHLDSGNNVTDAQGVGVFEQFDEPPAAPASRSPAPPRDPISHARSIIQAMRPGGRPPSVAGSGLTQAIFPGRSRATRWSRSPGGSSHAPLGRPGASLTRVATRRMQSRARRVTGAPRRHRKGVRWRAGPLSLHRVVGRHDLPIRARAGADVPSSNAIDRNGSSRARILRSIAPVAAMARGRTRARIISRAA